LAEAANARWTCWEAGELGAAIRVEKFDSLTMMIAGVVAVRLSSLVLRTMNNLPVVVPRADAGES